MRSLACTLSAHSPGPLRHRPWNGWRLLLCLAGLAACLAAGGAQAQEPSIVYLPLVSRHVEPVTLYGLVTLNGAPVRNVPVDLFHYQAGLGLRIATVRTDGQGLYRFRAAPLGQGESYFAYADGNVAGVAQGEPPRAKCWTRWLDSAGEGEQVHLADFDIAPLLLLDPPDGAYLHVPAAFRWQPRAGCTGDNYTFLVANFTLDAIAHYERNLGYASSATVTAAEVEQDLVYGQYLIWTVWTETPEVRCEAAAPRDLVLLPAAPNGTQAP